MLRDFIHFIYRHFHRPSSCALLWPLCGFLISCTPESTHPKRIFLDGEITRLQNEEDPSQNFEAPVVDQIQWGHQLESLTLNAEGELSLFLRNSMTTGSLAAQDAAKALFQRSVTPLQKLLLQRDVLFSPAHRALSSSAGDDKILPRALRAFGQSLDHVLQLDPQSPEGLNTLHKYYQLMTFDCPVKESGRCSFVQYLADQDNTYTLSLLKRLYRHREQSSKSLTKEFDQRFHIITLALDIDRGRPDDELSLMLLNALARKIKPQRKDSTSDVSSTQRYISLFANTLERNKNRDWNEGFFRDLPILHPWNLSRKKESPFLEAMTNLVDLGSRHLIYTDDGQLSSVFSKYLQRLSRSATTPIEQGFHFILKNLEGHWSHRQKDPSCDEDNGGPSCREANPNEIIGAPSGSWIPYSSKSNGVYNNLLLESEISSDYDEYDFLVHQIFHQHYNLEDASIFWQNTNRDPSRLMESISHIFRMAIVNATVLTNTKMMAFYDENPNLDIIELLHESKTAAAEVITFWSDIIRGAENLKQFGNAMIGIANGVHGRTLDSLNRDIDSLRKNIKYLVTYPNMYPFIELILKRKLDGEVPGPFGQPITIDPEILISSFFGERLEPWFNFGNDSISLDGHQIIYTFYFALLTSIFDTFSDSQLLNFSAKTFLSVLIDRLTYHTNKSLDDALANLTKDQKLLNDSHSFLVKACQEEKQLQQREEALYRPNEEVGLIESALRLGANISEKMTPRLYSSTSISFAQLHHKIYGPTSTGHGDQGHFFSIMNSKNIASTFTDIKSTFETNLFMAHALMNVYASFKPQAAEALRKEKNNPFQQIIQRKVQYLSLYQKIQQGLKGCEWVFLKREKQIKAALFLREVKFLDDLFNELWLIRHSDQKQCPPGTDCETDDLQPAMKRLREKVFAFSQNPAYPTEYVDRRSFITISSQEVSMRKFDILARLESYLNELFPGQYTIQHSANIQFSEIYSHSSVQSIRFDFSNTTYEDAREAFIRAGMKRFANEVSWANFEINKSILGLKANIVTTLFRLGPVSLEAAGPGNGSEHHLGSGRGGDGDSRDSLAHQNSHISSYNLCQAKKTTVNAVGLKDRVSVGLTSNSGTEDTQPADEDESDTALLNPEAQALASSCFRIGADEVIEFYNNMIDFYNIDSLDALILDLVALTKKGRYTDYEDVIKRKNEEKIYSHYDLLLRTLYSDQPVLASAKAWFLEGMVKYVASANKRAEENFIFGDPGEIELAFQTVYEGWMDRYFDNLAEFYREARQVKQDGNYFSGTFRYRREYGHSLGESTSGPLAPVISELAVQKMMAYIHKIDTDTGGHFFFYLRKQKRRLEELIGEKVDISNVDDETLDE